MEGDFTLELGYIVVAEAYRDLKLSRTLVESALDGFTAISLFATSRADRERMHRTLVRFSFEQVGHPYPSNEEDCDVLLFIRRFTGALG